MPLSQQDRPMQIVAAAIPSDGCMVIAVRGTETISELYSFEVDIAIENSVTVDFDAVLGKPAAVTIRGDGIESESRFIHGIIVRLSVYEYRQEMVLYRASLVPAHWLMTQSCRSRIYQNINVPDIAKSFFNPMGNYSPEIQGTFEPRNYCTQYRETDFDFVSRLMEEEGIFYFYKHTDTEGTLVTGNTPQSHTELPITLRFRGWQELASAEGDIFEWRKTQSLKTGNYELSDFNFEMPDKKLEANKPILDTVTVGTITHKLKNDAISELAIQDYPGGYAARVDGIDAGGGAQPDKLQKLFDDNKRTTTIRMQQESMDTLLIEGQSSYAILTPGFKFTLEGHADADGSYVLTSVTHEAKLDDDFQGYSYVNSFTCIPYALPFRPVQKTWKPTINGTQTAFVVGPSEAEMFVDKYGRVKVFFHWDPDGKGDAGTSCWVRVAQMWAGSNRGAHFFPRIGDEVVINFMEGDPDRPIIVGSVYNAQNMPMYTMPDQMTISGWKTLSTTKGDTETRNEFYFDDKKGSELVLLHAEKDMKREVQNDNTTWIGHDSSNTIDNNSTLVIGTKADADPHEAGKSTTTIHGDTKLTINKGDLSVTVATGKKDMDVKGPVAWTFQDNWTVGVTGKVDIKAKGDYVHIECPNEIQLKVGSSFIKITPSTITLSADHIELKGKTDAKITAPDVDVFGKSTLKAHSPDATFQGKSSAKLLGGTVEISGDSKAEMKVSGDSLLLQGGAALKGAKVDIIGTGITNIKGSVVQVNC